MASAGSIFVDLLLRDAKFTEGTKRASKALKDFGDVAGGAAKIAAGAIAAATAALAALTVRQAGVIDSTVKMSRALGISNENFQALSLVADEAGVSQEELASLITKSQKSIVSAARGSEAMSKAFELIGLSAKELIALSPDEQFQKIAEGLSEIENPTLRTNAALEIFGKQGGAALKLLEDFGEKAKEATKFNDEFGISVSSIDARKVEEANDTFDRVGRVIGGIGNIIAVKVAPLITEMAKALLGVGINGQTAGNAINSAFEGVATIIDFVRQGAIGLEAIFIKVSEGVLQFAVKFNELSVSFEEFNQSIIATDAGAARLQQARAALESTKVLAADAAAAYNNLQKEAENFETTSEKIARIQEDAQKRAEQTDKKKKNDEAAAKELLAALDLEEKRSEAIAKINAELEKQNDTIRVQNELFGESEEVIERQIQEQDIIRQLKESGVVLNERELEALREKLDLLKVEKDLNKEFVDAEKAREKAAEKLAKQEEENKKRLEDSVQTIREDLAGGIKDAITGAKSLGDAFKDVAAKIASAVIEAELLRVITAATGGSTGSGGAGGIFGFLSGLASFAVGTDYVPRDMIANIHKGEMIIPAAEANMMRNGGGAGITMNVYAQNADSFRASDRQITRQLKSRMATA